MLGILGRKSNEPAVEASPDAPVKKTRPRKLKSRIKGNSVIVTLTMGDSLPPSIVEYSTLALPQDMRDKLASYGACARLLGSVAGRDGKDAVAAIGKAWKELLDGAWKPRQPKAAKISTDDLAASINQLPADEQDAARTLLGKLSVSL